MKRLTIAIIILCLTLLISPSSAKAATHQQSSCFYYDFRTSESGWDGFGDTAYLAGSGFYDTAGGTDSITVISPALPEGITISSVSMTKSVSQVGTNPRTMWTDYSTQTFGADNTTIAWTQLTLTATEGNEFLTTSENNQLEINVDPYVNWVEDTDGYLTSALIYCDDASFSTQYKPTKLADTLETLNVPPVESLITTKVDANVYAAISGTVTTSTITNQGYRIVITAIDGSRAVYNNLSTVYPHIGDAVVAGCLIGKSGDKVANTVNTYDDPPGQIFFDVRDVNNAQVDWSNWSDPFGEKPCREISGNCTNANPQIDDKGNGWTTHDDNPFSPQPLIRYDDSIQLAYADTMSQTVVLSDPSNWYVTIVASQANNQQSLPTEFEVDVTLGDVTLYHLYAAAPLSEEIIEMGPFTPMAYDYPPDMYDFTIKNGSTASKGLRVTFACLHQAGALSTTNGFCYFPNWQFENNHDGWSSSAGAEWSQQVWPNENYQVVVLEPGEWISHPISLISYDSDDADYRLGVMARLFHMDLTDIVDLFVSGWETPINQQVMDGLTEELDIGDLVINWIVPLTSWTEFTVTTEDSPLEGDLTITNDANNTSDIVISNVCINPVSGTWPGQEDDDITIDPPACTACNPPDSLNLVEWFNYLACLWLYFFNCVIPQWVNQIGQTLYSIINGIGMLGRWLSAVLSNLGAYLLSLLAAFGQLILDIILGALASLWNWIASLDILQTLYDLISLLYFILTQGGTLIGLLAQLLLNLLGILATFAAMIADFKDAIFAAINSTTVATTAMPTCLAPEDPLYGLCIGLQIIQAVLTEFPMTAASFFVVAGCIGIITIVWTIRQIGNAVGEIQ